MRNIEGNKTPELSQDIDDMLASFSPQKTSGSLGNNEQRKASRFRVKWSVDVHIDDKVAYHGFINDISIVGASICLNTSFRANKCTLHIHIPPLDLTSKLRIMEVSGMLVYVVYDGSQQLFRAAINFLRFNPESDSAILKERLTKHHSKIPEISNANKDH